jgi:hypothetical protein
MGLFLVGTDERLAIVPQVAEVAKPSQRAE